MAKKFTINGKEYKAKEFDYNLMCDMEDLGFNIDDLATKPMSSIRGYFALCKNCTLATAGKELSNFVASGGSLDELSEAMTEQLENSDFFLGLTKGEAESNTADQEKAKK